MNFQALEKYWNFAGPKYIFNDQLFCGLVKRSISSGKTRPKKAKEKDDSETKKDEKNKQNKDGKKGKKREENGIKKDNFETKKT